MRAFFAIGLIASLSWSALWLTPEQQGQRLMDQGEYEQAATVFHDPMRIGVAWYRAGEFEKAEQAFARVPGSDGSFNRGNCLVMRGKYDDAVKQFDAALSQRPDWPPAVTNRAIAVARGERTKRTGGDMGDQEIGADEIRFDRNKDDEGQDTLVDQEQASSDATMQAVWLRRVQTKPATFLKSKFAFQLADQEAGDVGQ